MPEADKSIERRRLERRGGLSVDDPAVHAQTVSDEIDPANLAIWQRAIEMQQHPAKKAMLLDDYNRTIDEAKQLAGPEPVRVAGGGQRQYVPEFYPNNSVSIGEQHRAEFSSIADAVMKMLGNGRDRLSTGIGDTVDRVREAYGHKPPTLMPPAPYPNFLNLNISPLTPNRLLPERIDRSSQGMNGVRG